MEKMRAVQLFSPADLRCVEVEKPCITGARDVIIKVKACGVCGSDIMRVMVKGAYKHPITIGHEFSGVIEQAGTGCGNLKTGDNVTVSPLIPCGICDFCMSGQHTLCDNYSYYGSRIDGAMAEYIKVDCGNIFKLPQNLDFESGAMTDPVAVALHSIRKSRIEQGQTAAVFGLGAIGLIAVQWLKHCGCRKIFAVDIHDEKLKLAEKLGADICINSSTDNAPDAIYSMTKNRGANVVIELAGSKNAQVQAIDSASKMGKVIFCGISYDDLLIPNITLSKILRAELEIIGSWNSMVAPFPVNEWESSLDFMQSGKIKCIPLISHRFSLEQAMEAFNMMYYKKEIFNKVIFKPED